MLKLEGDWANLIRNLFLLAWKKNRYFLSSLSFVIRNTFPFLETAELPSLVCFLGRVGELGPSSAPLDLLQSCIVPEVKVHCWGFQPSAWVWYWIPGRNVVNGAILVEHLWGRALASELLTCLPLRGPCSVWTLERIP